MIYGALEEDHSPGNHSNPINHSDDRFYAGGTLSLTTQTEPFEAPPSPIVYDPYPDYNSREWKQQWKGYFYRCIGPRGTYLDHTSPDDMVSAYPGTQRGKAT